MIYTPITDMQGAEAFLTWLLENEMDYHLDDDPADIINFGTGEHLFVDPETVGQRIDEVYEHWDNPDNCPIGFFLDFYKKHNTLSA